MKKIFLVALFFALAGLVGFDGNGSASTNLLEVRAGTWPINLERDIDFRDTSYSLIFRDQSVITGVVLDTLPFADLRQLKYFQKGLTVLKTGNNGDIAKYNDYSIKRTDKRGEGTWYLLRYQWGETNFQQPEADLMINTIRHL